MLNVDTVAEVVPSKPLGSETEFSRMKTWLDERVSRGKKAPHSEVVALTPVLASLLLERNKINRNLSKFNCETIKNDILADRWMFNGESLTVSNTGELLDGQHRCQAVIDTRKTILVNIAFGAQNRARFTIDIGRPKSAPNFLHMKGYTDTNNLSAAVALILQYNKTGTVPINFARATKTEIVAAVDELRGIQISIDAVREATKKRLGSRSVLAFCHYVFKKKSGAEAADEFMARLIEGDGLRKDSPIFRCRERLIGLDSGARANVRSEVVFRAWNAWRRGETVSAIRLSGTLPKLER